MCIIFLYVFVSEQGNNFPTIMFLSQNSNFKESEFITYSPFKSKRR